MGRGIKRGDLIINLAGKSVNCRYNEKNKKEIFDSRTDAVKANRNRNKSMYQSP